MLNGGGIGLGVTFKGIDAGLSSTLGKLKAGYASMREEVKGLTDDLRANFKAFKEIDVLGKFRGYAQDLISFAKNADVFSRGLKQASVYAGASAHELDLMKAAAFDTAVAVKGFSANDAGQSLGLLSRLTGSATDAVKLLHPALNLAKIAELDAADASQLLVKTLKLFRLEATEAPRIVDAVGFAMQRLGLQGNQVQGGLAALSRGVQKAGASFEDSFLAANLAGQAFGGDFQRGARAVSGALESMTSDAKKSLKGLGGLGKDEFRSPLDIVEGLLAKNVGKGRAELVRQFQQFGPKASQALTAIYDGLSKATDKDKNPFDSPLKALRGLREELLENRGLGEKMAIALSAPRQVIAASYDSLKTAVALPLAEALRPAYQLVAQLSLALLKFVSGIPENVKRGIAQFVVLAVSIGTAFGAFVALKAVLGFIPGLLYAGAVAALSFAVTMAPLLVMFGLLALGAYALKTAYDQNLGGLADTVNGFVSKVLLFGRALAQAFGSGEFSGAVLEELDKGNEGVKSFVANIYRGYLRLEAIWNGIRAGFVEGVRDAEPAIDRLVVAMKALGTSFGLLGESATKGLAGTLDQSTATGKSIGGTFATIALRIVDGITAAAEAMRGFVEGARQALPGLIRSVENVIPSFGKMLDGLADLLGVNTNLSGSAVDGKTKWADLGKQFGVFSGEAVTGVINGFNGILQTIADLKQSFRETKLAALEFFDAVITPLEKFHEADLKLGRFRQKFFGVIPDSQINKLSELEKARHGLASTQDIDRYLNQNAAAVRGRQINIQALREEVALGPQGPEQIRQERDRSRAEAYGAARGDLTGGFSTPDTASGFVYPTAVPLTPISSYDTDSLEKLGDKVAGQPINVTNVIQIDGEELARAVHSRSRRSAQEGFESREFGG